MSNFVLAWTQTCAGFWQILKSLRSRAKLLQGVIASPWFLYKTSIPTQVRSRTGSVVSIIFIDFFKSVLYRAITKPKWVILGDPFAGDAHGLRLGVDVFNKIIASGTNIILSEVLTINAVTLALTSFPLYNWFWRHFESWVWMVSAWPNFGAVINETTHFAIFVLIFYRGSLNLLSINYRSQESWGNAWNCHFAKTWVKHGRAFTRWLNILRCADNWSWNFIPIMVEGSHVGLVWSWTW